MALREEKKSIYTHDDIWTDLPFFITAAFTHKNYAIGMHTHTFYEVNVVLSGSGTHYIERQSVPCGRGDVYVIPPQVRHGYGNTRSLDVFHLLLHERFMSRFAEELDSMDGFHLMFEIEPELRSRFDRSLFLHLTEDELASVSPAVDALLEIREGRDKNTCLMRNGMALYLIADLCRIYAGRHPQKSSVADRRSYNIMKSIEWMRENVAEKITADDMAKRADMSRSTYFRLFAKMFGTTPGEYLLGYRLRLAKKLLRSTDDTVLGIALACGFFDSSHFIRSFRKQEGVSPERFRRLTRAAENG